MPICPRSSVLSILTMVLLLAAVQGVAMPVIELPDSGPRTIGKGVLVLEDPSGQSTLPDVRQAQTRWVPSRESVFNRGYNSSAWWLAFELLNTGPTQQWLLEIAYAPLDHADLYVVRSSGEVETLAMGDKLPVSARPVFHRYFVAPLSLGQNERVSVYLRVQSKGSVQAPMTLWQADEFHANDVGVTAIQGLYYGGLLIIALYNLLVYSVLRERYYLYYVGWVLSMFWFMTSLNGWAFQFLWPEATAWNDASINASLSMVVLFGLLFASAFLGITKWSNGFRYAHYSYVAICLLTLAGGLVLPYATMARLNIGWAILGCIWGLAAGMLAMRRQVASAQIYVIAWVFMLVGGLIMALNKIHVLPRNLLTDYAIQLGSMLEVLLLSFALATRINRERQLRLEAQNSALDVQRKANEELEQRVQERTQALEEANTKLRELSDTDQLTGLKNRRFLNLYLEKEFARAQRYQHAIAVLMIDVDHFKSVNDTYGHPLGDDCLQEVAARIRQEMRWPTDTAARYGGEEFCVVLPETLSQGAQIVAERIRAKIEKVPIPTRAQSLSLTVSVGVHVVIPTPGGTPADLIAKADAALYEAKQHGRNKVVFSGSHSA